MMAVATRVPDHGRLEPWRFILYRGEARAEVGKGLAALAEQREGPLTEGRRNQELARFSRAPLVVGVVSVPRENPKIPQWEMFLSGGMAAMNLMIAANALGYGTNLISNWYSDVPEGRALLGLAPQERVIGFIHIGSYLVPAPDRPRPDPTKLYGDYAGPWSG
jgi:nitroreductase